MQLNPQFLQRMQSLLGDTYEEYLSYINRPPFKGYRINRLKADENILAEQGIMPSPSPFSPDVHYLPEDSTSMGNHPLHHAGAFYLGDPSATSAVTALDVQKGDIVLDLCASPGGKTVGIASALKGSGFLISNETVSSRIAPLISNIERTGICNSAVTNSRPDILCSSLPEFFDKILVDAPCSGEGMMLRDSAANENWSIKNIEACAQRQLKILESAAESLRPGGVLVYSTCTFAPEENELTVEKFLSSHPDFYVDDIPAEFGSPAFAGTGNFTNINKCRRIFPMQGGDGHFVARLRRKSDGRAKDFPTAKGSSSLFEEFWKECFLGDIPSYSVRGDKIFICKYDLSDLPGIVREGVFAGYIKGNRFEPAHALFAAAEFQPKRILNITSEDIIHNFLLGLEIPCEEKGYTAVRISNVPLSFGKASGGMLKNHYPKGLRLLK